MNNAFDAHMVQRRTGVGFAIAAALAASSCGSGGSNPPPPTSPYGGTTQVTLVLGSVANDLLAEYDVTFQSITLTSQSGQTVTLLGQPQNAEFIHVNGANEPMLTMAVPQDIYTSAAVTISSTSMTCLSVASTGGILVSTFANNALAPGNVTVTLPQPIAIAGNGQGLLLKMQVSQSAQLSNCAGGQGATYSFTPTFALSAFALPAIEPTASSVLRTLDCQETGVSGATGSLQVTLAPQLEPAAPIEVQTNASTVFQGSISLAYAAIGQFLQIDGSLQADGSVLATRVALADPAAQNALEGPILTVDSAVPYLAMYPLVHQGPSGRSDVEVFDFSGASFRIDGLFTNLSSLPFAASFNPSNMVAGQNVYVSSPVLNNASPPNYSALATTITLEPQTIDGTIVATASSGGFTIYTVQLAAYDLFPALAVQAGQTTLLGSPATVEVYVDQNTQQLGTELPTSGSVMRFFGLIFDDGGTLRMDCSHIDDGVAL